MLCFKLSERNEWANVEKNEKKKKTIGRKEATSAFTLQRFYLLL